MASFGKFEDADVQKFIAHFDSAVHGDVVIKELETAFLEITKKALRIVQKNTPVRQKGGGNLRRSWQATNVQVSGGNMWVEIYNGADYAIYVEMGHRGVYVPKLGKVMWTDRRWTEGKFMLQKSISEWDGLFDQVLERAFENALSKALGL
jgi:hypothetical protein